MAVMIGVDPHKATHTAVVVDQDEHVVEEMTIRASGAQGDRLRGWADRFGERVWAVESAQGLGYLLAQQLTAAGETVLDVPPVLASRVRLLGSGRSQKNDSNDARAVAVAALRSDRLLQVRPDDHVRVLRMLVKRHRDLSRLRNKMCCRLHALLLEVTAGGAAKRITVTRANTVLDGLDVTSPAMGQRVEICRELVEDIARFDGLLKVSSARIRRAVAASGTTVTQINGVGPIGAAMIVGQSGDINRFASKSHYASYNATAPIEASSGPTKRHRLNPRGNRQLNWAIHIAAITQLSHPTEGRIYYERKVAEGKTNEEAIRALKRRISDRVYQNLVDDYRRAEQG